MISDTFSYSSRPRKDIYYRSEKPSAYFIKSGSGPIEIDFRNYTNWSNKLIFLDRNQYIKFPHDDFEVKRLLFDSHEVGNHKDYRVLFKHVVNLGSIDYFESAGWVHASNASLLDYAAFEWSVQNPFGLIDNEKELLFDTKEKIDSYSKINEGNALHLLNTKVGVAFDELVRRRKLLNSMRDLAFSSKSMKEIAYDHDFHDPSHFSHFFKQRTNITPQKFRYAIEYPHATQFLQDVQELIIKYHLIRRDVDFYAEKLKMSKSSFTRKFRHYKNLTFYKLLKQELLITAKACLQQGMMIKEIATHLRFKEPNHFTAFFKSETGLSPTEYLQRYNN